MSEWMNVKRPVKSLDSCICQAHPIPNPLFHNRECPYYKDYQKSLPSATRLDNTHEGSSII